jgi:molybdate/tungstate transport system substrate-binding protein
MQRNVQLFVLGVVLCIAVAFCGCTSEAPSSPGEATPTPAEPIELKVFHAGSLTSPFEKMEAAFEAEYPNVDVQLHPGGSTAIAKEIVDLDKPADVYASADYSLIPSLMMPDDADWYLTFAKNRMVLCYTGESKYADEITADNWYEILAKDDIRWAFSDPNQDPCGYRTPMVIQLAELHYGDDQIFDTVVAANSNITATEENGVYTIHATVPDPAGTLSIRPKSVELVQMLQTGGLDYAWEYRSVAVQNDLEFIELPEAIDLSSIDFEDTYAQVQIECTSGINKGSPIVYGATVPKNADNPDMGLAFIEMLIGETGQQIMEGEGQPPIVPADGYGAVPEELTGLVTLKS